MLLSVEGKGFVLNRKGLFLLIERAPKAAAIHQGEYQQEQERPSVLISSFSILLLWGQGKERKIDSNGTWARNAGGWHLLQHVPQFGWQIMGGRSMSASFEREATASWTGHGRRRRITSSDHWREGEKLDRREGWLTPGRRPGGRAGQLAGHV